MEEMINLTINNLPVTVKKGTKIMEAARKLHIDIPHLCYHPDQAIKARCRLCSVEVVGKKRLLAACATECWEGMQVYTDTKIVRDTQKGILQLIMADHEENCLTCPRNGNCDLQDLCSRFNILRPHLPHVSKPLPKLCDNPSLVSDPEKCVKCGRCIRACKDIQGIEALGFSQRSINLSVGTAYKDGFLKTDCILCGQCTVVCPVGALVEKDDTDKVMQALLDPEKVVIVQTAPSIRVTLGDAFGLPDASIVTGKMVTALKMMGFNKVFDTNYGADMTITEEAHEFVERFKKKDCLPMFTSCCPGWVNFVEKHYPDLKEHLSSAKSPMSMFSAILKSEYAQRIGKKPSEIYSVAIMPCIAKKYERQRPQLQRNGVYDTDAVLTTRELIKMIKSIGIEFDKLPAGKFDDPMGDSTGAGAIFGATGGVMEAALRTADDWLAQKPLSEIEYKTVRGMDNGIKEATLEIAGQTIKIAVVQTLKYARIVLDKVRSGQCDYDFVEVMACPGGCIGGGGQPVTSTRHTEKERINSLYAIDRTSKFRKSHENPYLIELYKNYLDDIGSKKAHELLHTSFEKQPRWYDEALKKQEK